jgi:ATP-binding cassette, subfamily B, bacterial
VKRSGTLGLLRDVAGYARPHALGTALVLFTIAPAVAFFGLQPLLYKRIIDEAVMAGDWHRLLRLLVVLAGLLVMRFAGEFAREYAASRVGVTIANGLRARVFDHLQRLSVEFYARSTLGDLMARYTANIGTLEGALTTELPALFTRIATLVLCVTMLFSIEPRLAALILVLMTIVVSLPFFLGPRADEASYRRQEDAATLAGTVQDALGGQLVIKVFALQSTTLGRLRGTLARLAKSTVRFGLLSGVLSASMSVGGASLNAVALGVGGYLVISRELTLGTLVAFLDLMWYCADALHGLGSSVRPLQEAGAANERIQELLLEHASVADDPGAGALPPLEREIRFDGVTFGYPGAPPSLSALSLSIPRGATVALVGPSGCGKSTALGLLMRLYDPDAGSVSVDGRDLRRVSQGSLRAQIGAVFQESLLFNVSVRENIRMGRPDATDAEVEAVARAAEVDGFALDLPEGYDTPVGERGSRLSGGQRQRIAVARAILRDPAILVLDEATSALDPATEQAINATLERVGAGRTVVSVTHRLASAVNADVIFVLDRGRVVEHGRHAEMLARGGAYLRLWERQAGVHVSDDGLRASVDATLLRQMPVFGEVPVALLPDIAARFASEELAEGRTLVYEGDPGDKFYLVARGKVEVVKATADGQGRRLAVLSDGDYFGEVALLRNVPRSATVRTLAPTVLLSLNRAHFHDLVEKSPELRQALERVMIERVPEEASGADELIVSMRPGALAVVGRQPSVDTSDGPIFVNMPTNASTSDSSDR